MKVTGEEQEAVENKTNKQTKKHWMHWWGFCVHLLYCGPNVCVTI
jgi:hypothetical protein